MKQELSTVTIDLAKKVFHLVGADTCASRKLIALATQQVQRDHSMSRRGQSSRSSVKGEVPPEPAG
jgi:hypothetical protein